MKGRKQQRKRKLKHFRPPRTADEFFALPEEFQTDYKGALRVISKMRSERLSLKKAAHDMGSRLGQ